MTNLAKALRPRLGPEKRPTRHPITVSVSEGPPQRSVETWEVGTEHVLEATLRARAFLRESESEEVKERVARALRRHLVEVVFGEFRTRFRALEQALWEYDVEHARSLLATFEREMFATEE